MARRRVQIAEYRDWSAGLNYREDSFSLPKNQLADMLNMRIKPNGGLQRRGTMKALNGSDLASARNLFSFFGNGVTQIIAQIGNTITVGTGGSTFTSAGTAAPWNVTTTGIMRAAVMARVGTATSERLYVQRNGEQVAFKWDGTVGAAMTDSSGAYNDNLAAPAGGKMPKAKYITPHLGFMFHAYTFETRTQSSRIRWSFPGEPEDYRTNDYIDVGANDGDTITGIASVGHVLWIFKQNSVWALTGFDPNNFALQKRFDGIGAVSQEAIVDTPDNSIFFFDGTKGVYAIDAKGSLHWLWAELVVNMSVGTIPPVYVGNVTCGWMDNRLWVSVPWLSSTVNIMVFVFDPHVGKSGAWYRYRYCDGTLQASNIGIGPMLEWSPTNTQPKFLALSVDGTQVEQLDFDNGSLDTYKNTGAVTSTYTSFFTTAWFDAGLPGVKKRWRGPSFIFDADFAATVGMRIYANFSNLEPIMTMQHTIMANHDGGKLWGANNWGADNWGPAPLGTETIMRHSPIGQAYAIQFRLDGPPDSQWGMDGLELRYIPKAIR